MGMARGDLRPCYSPRAAGVHSPAFPVVADGAKDVVAAPMVLAPRADGQRQRPDNGASGFAQGSRRPTHGSPGAGPDTPASALTPV